MEDLICFPIQSKTGFPFGTLLSLKHKLLKMLAAACSSHFYDRYSQDGCETFSKGCKEESAHVLFLVYVLALVLRVRLLSRSIL